MWVPSLGQEDPLEEEMATHSSILCLENPMDRGAWWATVHRVAKSDTRLKQLGTHTSLCSGLPLRFSFPAVLRKQTLWGVSIPSALFPSPRPSICHVLGEWVLTRPLIPVVQGYYFAVCLGRSSSPTSSAQLCEQDAGLITSPDADEDQRMGVLEC